MGYMITDYKAAGKGRIGICLNNSKTLWLYAGEARQLSLEPGMELSEEQYQHILHGVIGRRAVKRAMHLLERQDRTKQQLCDKLLQSGYPPEAVEDAVSYVQKYHYLDDGRYARTYIRNHQDKRSRLRLRQDLLRRGVPKEIRDQSMQEEFCFDEREQIKSLLEKRRFDPDTADAKETGKIYRFLLGRGFRSSDISAVLRDAGQQDMFVP